MTTARKVWILAGALVVLTVGCWLLMVGAVYAMGGVMSVHVLDRESGRDLYVPVPMALLELATVSIDTPAIYGAGIGDVRIDGMDLDLGAAGAALLGVLEELDELPDATLIEVVEPRSSVRISKAADKLVVEIDDPGSSLSFSLPTRSVSRLARRVLG